MSKSAVLDPLKGLVKTASQFGAVVATWLKETLSNTTHSAKFEIFAAVTTKRAWKSLALAIPLTVTFAVAEHVDVFT